MMIERKRNSKLELDVRNHTSLKKIEETKLCFV